MTPDPDLHGRRLVSVYDEDETLMYASCGGKFWSRPCRTPTPAMNRKLRTSMRGAGKKSRVRCFECQGSFMLLVKTVPLFFCFILCSYFLSLAQFHRNSSSWYANALAPEMILDVGTSKPRPSSWSLASSEVEPYPGLPSNTPSPHLGQPGRHKRTDDWMDVRRHGSHHLRTPPWPSSSRRNGSVYLLLPSQTPGRIQITSVEDLLNYISWHIYNTWGTSDGVIVQATPSLSDPIKSLRGYCVNIDLIGLRLRRSESSIRLLTSLIQVNHTSWGSVVTKLCPIQIIYLDRCQVKRISAASVFHFVTANVLVFPLLICGFLFFFLLAFIMTKRNSSFANLDSAWDLRFDSWSQPMSACRPRHSSAAASSSTTAASSRQGLRLPGYHSAHDSHSAAICMDIQHLHPALQCQIRIPLGIERSTIHSKTDFHKIKECFTPKFSRRWSQDMVKTKSVSWWSQKPINPVPNGTGNRNFSSMAS